MFNAITELFLSEYFVIMASGGKFVDDRKDMFARLSKIFMLGNSETDKLFALCDNELVRDIVTEQDYLRYQRLQKYTSLTNDNAVLNSDIEEIIRVKGNALAASAKQKLTFNPQTSRNAEYSALLSAANGGLVIALKILGILQCEGIFLEKNVNAGVRNLTKVANWNDCVGTLALLRYSQTDRAYNASRLRMIVVGTPFEKLFDKAVKTYGISAITDIPEVRLLNRAFESAILNRNVYNPMSARILYSNALSLKDKEKAMLSQDAGKLNVLSDLPLKLAERSITDVDVRAIDSVALKRPIEQRRIKTALNNADLRIYEQYRPLCLASDSQYVLNMYARAIFKPSETCRFDKVNIAELSGYDLEPSCNNVFVRSIDEDADNRFLLFFVGNISDRALDFVKNFLLSSRRAKFHLNNPSVTLDLSPVLPICFCDRRNARLLEDILDVVQLDDVSDIEFPQALSDIIADKKALYGVDITIKGAIGEIFADCSVDKAERLIDVIARNHRKDGKSIVITRDAVAEYEFGFNRRIGFRA